MPVVKANGININYKVEGTGEPLVMISGFTMNLGQWRRQVPSFKKHYQVITFDNRGAGKSGKPEGPYSSLLMAEDTIQLMDHLKIEKAHILGGSMGTLVAQEIAISYPKRVMKLILSSPWACHDDGANGFTSEVLAAMELPLRQLLFKFADALVTNPFNRLILIPVLRMQIRRIKGAQVTGITGQAGCILGFNSVDRLQAIKAPTLIMAGTGDRLIKQPGSAETIARKIPNSRLVTINGGPHALPMEQTRIFNKEVLDFLKSGLN